MPNPPVTIDGYRLDATLSEEHGFDSEVTDHPIESGSDITDHVRVKPLMVTMDCVVSNTPIGELFTARDADSVPSEDAYALMLRIRDAREPVTIETSLGVFDNMLLQAMSVPRSAKEGDALHFRVTFKQVVLVTNNRTTIQVAVPRAAKKTNLGNKASAYTPSDIANDLPAGPDAKAKHGYRGTWAGRILDGIGLTDGPGSLTF